MKFTVIRLLKSTFIRLRLHVLFGPLESFFIQLAYLSKLSKWAAQHSIADNDFVSKWNYNKRYNLYQSIFDKEQLNTAINYLEFGVADGYSFKWWLKKNTDSSSRFYGFDTFTGLPEDFGPYKKGTFNSNKAVPQIDDRRGQFFQGLFQQTLPKFIQTFNADKKLVLMLDADLYSSTLFTLATLAPYLKNGDIIFFDEFVVPTHEFMAYKNFTDSFYFNLEPVGAANNYYFVAFKVVIPG